MAPLYALLQSNAKWVWADEQERAFEDAKRALFESSMPVRFDNKLPVVLSCDASPTRVSCVLAHVIKNEEHPVLFISRTLSTAKRNYSQLKREALAIIFEVVSLRQYLLGRHFVIHTDHKPLLSLFSPDKTQPPVAAARVLLWSLILVGYQCKMVFRKGTEHANVDALSRLCRHHLLTIRSDPVTSSYTSMTCQNHHVQQRISAKLPARPSFGQGHSWSADRQLAIAAASGVSAFPST